MKIIRTVYEGTKIESAEDNETVIATCDDPMEAVDIGRALTQMRSQRGEPWRYVAVPDDYPLKKAKEERQQIIESALETLTRHLGIEDGKPYLNSYHASQALELLIDRAGDLTPAQ